MSKCHHFGLRLETSTGALLLGAKTGEEKSIAGFPFTARMAGVYQAAASTVIPQQFGAYVLTVWRLSD